MNSAIERLLSLRVTDIMTRRVVTVSPDQKMSEAARLLIEKRVTGAPVVDAEGKCVGILSATDYLHRHGGLDVDESSETLVHEHMSTEVKTISVAGQPYTLGWICEPHNCGGNEVFALFAPKARQAWGLLIRDGQRRWLGNPDAAVQAAILSGVE